jgi:hypothetical protein
MDLRIAARAMLDSYAEHLNHHCARCTAAFDALRAALETPDVAMPTTKRDDKKIAREFRAMSQAESKA